MKAIAEETGQNSENVARLDSAISKTSKLFQDGFDCLKREVILVENAGRRINDSNEKIENQQGILSGIVENLFAISGENAARCQETSATMESVSRDVDICNQKIRALTELSESLKSQVAYFKL